jgi:predicted nucleic acid-binding protein
VAAKVIAADACVLLNLLATRRARELLQGLDTSLIATPLTGAQVQYLAGPPDDDGHPTREPAQLGNLVAGGHLHVRAIPEAALDLFVRCAADLHEADASSIALAVGFGVALATDDGLERRVAAREAPELEIVGTLALVRRGSAAIGMDHDRVVKLARDLRVRGNFLPPRQDPDREWYQNLLTPAAGKRNR